MASRPNPSWSEPQKKVHKEVQEGMEIIIPYFGPEIPSLDNHTPEQLCDDIGVVKACRKAFDQVEKTLIARFKPRMNGTECRGTRFIASMRTNERTALDQGRCKDLFQRADDEGIDLEKLLDLVIEKKVRVPNEVFIPEDSGETNSVRFHVSTGVETLTVKDI